MKTVTDGDGLFAPMFNSLASLWPVGTAVLSGCTVIGSESALQVTVAAGTATVAGTPVTVSGGTAAVTANAGTETRYDLLYATGAGALGIALGGTSTPALPGGCIPLAVLEVGPGQTTVPADRIHDARLLASHVVAGQLTLAAGLVSSGKTILNSSGELAGGGVAEILYPDPDRAAANVCAENLTENNTLYDAWTQLLVLPAVSANLAIGPTHTVQVAWEHRESYAGSWDVASRVYVNGVAVGPIRGTSSTEYAVVSDPIDVSQGDVISIWGHGDGYNAVRIHVRNVKAYAVAVPCARPAAW